MTHIQYVLKEQNYPVEEASEYDLKYDPLANHRKRLAATKQSVWLFDNGTVAFKNSTKHTGLNRKTGQRYWRWSTDNSVSIKESKDGRLVPLECARGRWHGGQMAYNYWRSHTGAALMRIYEDKTMPVELPERINSILGRAATFPMKDLLLRDSIPVGGFNLVQSPTVRDLTAELFGKSRVRKDLVKAVASSPLTVSMLASNFRGLVPIDWIVGFLRNNSLESHNHLMYDEGGFSVLRMRPVLKALDQRSYRHLLNDDLRRYSLSQVSDVVRYSVSRGVESIARENYRPTTWVGLHDDVWGTRRRAAYEPPMLKPVKIKPNALAKKIHEAFEGTGLTHVMPDGTEMLIEWSSEMSNCIRGYDRQAANGKTILGAVVRDKRMIANYEVSAQGELRQLLGRFNQVLDDPDYGVVVSILERAGVTTGQFWGKKDGSESLDMDAIF